MRHKMKQALAASRDPAAMRLLQENQSITTEKSGWDGRGAPALKYRRKGTTIRSLPADWIIVRLYRSGMPNKVASISCGQFC